MTTTTCSVPEVSCETCKNAIEGAVGQVAGVAAVEVDVPAKTVTVRHDDRVGPDQLVEVIEDQGYDVAGHR
ncbi:copper chaperone/mercuric ion binding protein [Amycolatopsis echigonensis]|uniref:Copper chaperone/mercuric ion binding protein n=2 Tax=Pseudonocardiaceae TaxID=2070 RepID=A0A2N3WJL3_9PSEU|nr:MULTISPECIES: cation transporter [Pseudonocardiaceae]AEA23546.1 Heavy metal transport/detoxification protein [Pseudonocardia dioxanivorans CB1190]PKV94060.1 copper chaperone/mercuric ion binding protein [Amycolatopsis niigatensis]